MISKLYVATLILSLAICAFFGMYAWSWLQSIGQPAVALEGYRYHAQYGWFAIWITSLTLLTIANVILWTTSRSWALFTTLGYFTITITAAYFLLDQARFEFETANGFAQSTFSVNRLFAVMLIFLVAVIVLSDNFIISRLREKMSGEVAGSSFSKGSSQTAESETTRSESTDRAK